MIRLFRDMILGDVGGDFPLPIASNGILETYAKELDKHYNQGIDHAIGMLKEMAGNGTISLPIVIRKLESLKKEV